MQSARESVSPLEPGCRLTLVTKGQWSMLDLLEALLEAAAPADVVGLVCELPDWREIVRDLGRGA